MESPGPTTLKLKVFLVDRETTVDLVKEQNIFVETSQGSFLLRTTWQSSDEWSL
ncbi:uncharacterized protein PHALS_14463 [Plasmopara halstedii]|uniref:Uncharacterized protein n=1 Tax=Plasmopara halstedii TaxID=4781 RepID=A0A0P1ARL6_PLAHL|nr:uncharacterized protein PHALS_14463 [Plasmopara halstedii]CEG44205.1 hypothetical protein PHALS_14463 [Plasmopara halstedii]|eukprot:XP_024580574.1 hypothetical protein PHALS_14463 [Plasmopara halstedii]